MTTITEDYISFETAKLLKEKGFKTPVETGYYGDGRICHNLALDFMDYNHEDGYYSRPTIQMATKWLRKVHNVNIDIVSEWNQKRFEYQVFIVTPENAKYCYIDDKLYLSYEDACEAAIKYCLENLI